MLDRQAFETALTAAAPKLWRIARAMCRDHHAAQDLVQEAGMIAWKKRESFEPGTRFEAWTGQIVRNLALRHGRDGARRATVALAVEPSATPSPPQASPAMIRGAQDQATAQTLGDRYAIDDRLASALAQLSDIARACFVLRSVESHSYQEISEVLDIPANTAMSHVHRSRQRVLEAMSTSKEELS